MIKCNKCQILQPETNFGTWKNRLGNIKTRGFCKKCANEVVKQFRRRKKPFEKSRGLMNFETIGAITSKELEVFLLYAPKPYGKNLNIRTIAKKIHITKNAVKGRLLKIKKRNRNKWNSIFSKKSQECPCEEYNEINIIELLLDYVPGPIGNGMSVNEIANKYNIKAFTVRKYFKDFRSEYQEAWDAIVSMRRAMSNSTRVAHANGYIEDSSGVISGINFRKFYWDI